MFTGIVEELGEVVAIDHGTESARLVVRGPVVCADARRGDSIAVNGICLTVIIRGADTFTADVMHETLRRTSLSTLVPGARVNLERPVPVTGRLGGHVVQGHVDGVGAVVSRISGERWELVRIAVPSGLLRYIVEKGSVALDGVSLTVAEVGGVAGVPDGTITVSLIPETLARTTLGRREIGEPVNIEVDVLAKYVESMLGGRSWSGMLDLAVAR